MALPTWAGFLAIGFASLGFGGCMVPLKRFETGDGFFFQTIFVCGVLVSAIRGFPQFYATAMAGGALWVLGNSLTAFIVKTIGLGVGMSTWGIISMLTGWATGTFGLFGLKSQPVPIPWLSYVGASLAVLSIVCFFFIDPNATNKKKSPITPEDPKEMNTVPDATPSMTLSISEPLPLSTSTAIVSETVAGSSLSSSESEESANSNKSMTSVPFLSESEHKANSVPTTTGAVHSPSTNLSEETQSESDSEDAPVDLATVLVIDSLGSKKNVSFEDDRDMLKKILKLSPIKQKIIGFSLAVAAGLAFGCNFTPPQWVMDNVTGASQDGLDYVFSHFTGIMITSSLVMAMYAMAMKNQPFVYAQCVLPTMGGGVLWSIGQVGWFIANSSVSFVISFPILCIVPSVIATCIGYFLFKENQGRRNLLLLLGAAALAALSVTCTTLAKVL